MSISTADIKQLREVTGVGILDCKKALQETEGDLDQAIELLRKKGLASAAKKTNREANEGLISAWVSDDGQTGVMIEVNCETDFVARTDDFKEFVDALVRQLAAQANIDSVEALLAAPYDDSQTVQERLTETIAKLGENIIVRQVARLQADGGLVDSYIHIGGRVGVLVAMTSEAGSDGFVELLHDLALQIAAVAPRYVSEAEVPAEVIAAEKDIYQAQLAEENKPPDIKERIIEGKVKKWYSEVTLLNHAFVKDNDLTIAQLLKNKSKELGSDLTVQGFARFELGVN
ncbi:MAG TPA: translation elongation factor Ts [Anaerolineae bacterium]